MERFCINVKHVKGGATIELLMVVSSIPGFKKPDAVVLGSASSPELYRWLCDLSESALCDVDDGRWLTHTDGMRLALAFVSARHLTSAAKRAAFATNLNEMPSEAVLYWFTLCCYGRRMSAGRAALRALLTGK